MVTFLERLEATIGDRCRDANPTQSYVAGLAADPARAIRKLGEEAVETLIAALQGGDADLTAEAADLVFHLMVVLSIRRIPWSAVEAELAGREGTSGHAEKAARSK